MLLLASVAPAQFPHNKLDWSNWWITDREDLFPSFTSAGGNVAGDGLFKIVPGWLLEREADHQLSGYQIAISIDDAYTQGCSGGFCFPVVVNLPGVQLYRTKVASGVETIDLSRPIGPQYDPIPLVLPADGSWVVEVAFAPNATNPKLKSLLAIPAREGGQRASLAMLVLAEPGGKRSTTVPGVVLQSSYQERHLPPAAQASYSGVVDARAGTIKPWGTLGQPSATGELYAMPRFAQPTLQLRSDSSGGLIPDPQQYETHAGAGAYATDLATRQAPGFFGFFVQAEQHDPAGGSPTHQAFPFLVALSSTGPTAALPLTSSVAMRVNPNELAFADLLVAAGLFGPLDLYRAGGSAGYDQDQLGAWVSPRVTLAPDPSMKGLTLWVQALITDNALQPVDTSNAVRWSVQ